MGTLFTNPALLHSSIPVVKCSEIHHYSHAGYDVKSYFLSAFIEVRKPVQNAATDGFGSNFSGAPFCLAQPIGGGLLIR